MSGNAQGGGTNLSGRASPLCHASVTGTESQGAVLGRRESASTQLCDLAGQRPPWGLLFCELGWEGRTWRISTGSPRCVTLNKWRTWPPMSHHGSLPGRAANALWATARLRAGVHGPYSGSEAAHGSPFRQPGKSGFKQQAALLRLWLCLPRSSWPWASLLVTQTS